MTDPLPGYDDWKLDNGPYENDGYDDDIDDAYEAYLERLAARDEEPPDDR